MATSPRIRGIRSPVQGGHVLGRTGPTGDVQQLAISSLTLAAPALPGPGAIVMGSATSMGLSAVGNTTGASSSTTKALTAESLSFAGIVSGGFSAGSIVISATAPSASATSMGLTATGNTTGASSSETKALTAETISGAGGVSVGFSGGSIVISGATPTASATSMGLTATGNTTGATSSMTQAITGETISGAGGVSVGFSGGSIIISGATGGGAGATSGNVVALGNIAGNSSSGTQVLTAMSFSGAGGVSVGMTTGVLANTIVISGATTAASATSMGLSAVGNTTGATSSTTQGLTAETLSFAGIVSGGFSAGSIIISATAPAASATSGGLSAVGNTTGATSSMTQAITGETISGAGGVSVGFSAGSVIISGAANPASATSMGISAIGNGAGSTSSQTQAITAESISFGGGVSGGFSEGTLIISGATRAALLGSLSYYEQPPPTITGTRTTFGGVIGSFYFATMNPPGQVSFNHVGMMAALKWAANTCTISSTAGTTTGTASFIESNDVCVGIYTNSSNNMSFSLSTSTVAAQNLTGSVSWSGNGSSLSISHSLSVGYCNRVANTTDTFSSSFTTAALSKTFLPDGGLNNGTSSYATNCWFGWALTGTLDTGIYLVAAGISTNSTHTATGAAQIAIGGGFIWGLGFSFGSIANGTVLQAPGSQFGTTSSGAIYGVGTSTSAGGVVPTSACASSLTANILPISWPYFRLGLF